MDFSRFSLPLSSHLSRRLFLLLQAMAIVVINSHRRPDFFSLEA